AVSNGTRNIPVVFAITFLWAYFFGQGVRLTVRVRIAAILAALLIGASAYYGVQFRTIGLAAYLAGAQERTTDTAPRLLVDDSLYTISRLTNIFPTQHDFVGMAIPLW